MLIELTRAVEERHSWTRGHAARVAVLAMAVAHRLGWDRQTTRTSTPAPCCTDVGKLSLAAETLPKPAR